MRAKWIIVGIFAPELVVSTAFAQYLTARWLKNEIQKDIKHRTESVRMPLVLLLRGSRVVMDPEPLEVRIV